MTQNVTDPALRQELLSRFERDQAARRAAWDNEHPAPEAVAVAEAIDREHTSRMKEIVARHGWPGKATVGSDGSQAAWLLVQHADHDVPFQKQCVPLLQDAVERGDADPSCLAYLIDRVAVAEQREQTYGTQFDADREPHPIADRDHVDERRRRVGLEPLADYRRRMWETYGPPPSGSTAVKPGSSR